MTIFFVVYIGKTIEEYRENEKKNNVEETQHSVDFQYAIYIKVEKTSNRTN